MLSLSSKETESVTHNLAQFKFYIDLLKQYRCLVSQIPEKLSFIFFEVGLMQPKIELRERVAFLLKHLLKRLEEDLTQQAKNIEQRVHGIISRLQTPLNDAHDVVEMDDFKNSLPEQIHEIQLMVEEQNKCTCFLFKNNDVEGILTPARLEGNYVKEGQCWYYLRQTHTWREKIEKALLSTEDSLSDQRKNIENQFYKCKKQIDDDLKQFYAQLLETRSIKRVHDT
jgi:ElaB/YqjD/DUF883 family membrane-anchored ribosome-binding protein